LNRNNQGKYPRLANCIAWRLNQWDEKQRKEWQETMKKGHEQLLQDVPQLREILEKVETPEEQKQRKEFLDSI
jgi:uncharacterized phage-like protein YoqJ